MRGEKYLTRDLKIEVNLTGFNASLKLILWAFGNWGEKSTN